MSYICQIHSFTQSFTERFAAGKKPAACYKLFSHLLSDILPVALCPESMNAYKTLNDGRKNGRYWFNVIYPLENRFAVPSSRAAFSLLKGRKDE
jgi:hypothetical protein